MPSGNLVDVTCLSPLPDQVIVPDVSRLPAQAQVLAAMQWGCLAPVARNALGARGVTIIDVPIEADALRPFLMTCWGGPEDESTRELGRALAEALGRPPSAEPAFATEEFARGTPLQLSMLGCRTFRRADQFDHGEPIAVVVGDSLDDFAYALALDRCLGRAMWLPTSLIGEVGEDVAVSDLAQVLSSTRRTGSGQHRAINVVSRSVEEGALQEICEGLCRSGWFQFGPSPQVEELSLPYHRPLTVLDADRYQTLDEELFVDGVTARGLQTRIPSGVSADDVLRLKWWNDAIRVDHQLPARWCLNDQVVARSSAWRSHARTRRDGIAFESHPSGFVLGGTPLERVIDRPRLRYLDANGIFTQLAAEAGLELRESAAGRFTSRTLDLWGSRESLVSDLGDSLMRKLFAAWVSEAPSGEQPGNLIGGRRYMSFDDLKDVTADDDGLNQHIDRLLASGVIRRGLSLSCPNCSYFGWYDAEMTGAEFTCQRCRTPTVITSASLRGSSAEPTWYYQLAEVVVQAIEHHFAVPLLAVDLLGRNAQSVLAMTDHEIDLDGHTVEVDIWAIIDGRIVIGEAKSADSLGPRQKRNRKAAALRTLADALTVDSVVFATSAPDWQESTVDAVASAFSGARADVRYMTSVDPAGAALG
jgi:hypothetical protein